jgi:hypothetical protein
MRWDKCSLLITTRQNTDNRADGYSILKQLSQIQYIRRNVTHTKTHNALSCVVEQQQFISFSHIFNTGSKSFPPLLRYSGAKLAIPENSPLLRTVSN